MNKKVRKQMPSMRGTTPIFICDRGKRFSDEQWSDVYFGYSMSEDAIENHTMLSVKGIRDTFMCYNDMRHE